MHILQVRSALTDEGPGTQPLTLAREFRRLGHTVSFATSGGVFVPEIENAGFLVHRIPWLAFNRRGPIDILRAVHALAEIIEVERPSVIHGHNAAATGCAAVAAWLVGQFPRLATSVRGIEERQSHKWRNQIWRLIPGRLLAVSEYTRQLLVGFGVSQRRVVVTFNGVDLERFDPNRITGDRIRSEFGLENKIVITTVGKMVLTPNGPGKGQHILVEAIARLVPLHREVHLLVVGEGDARPVIEETIHRCGVGHAVTLTGRRFDIAEILAASDIYVLASVYGEMFPNSIVEALAMGKPWVGSEIAGLRELTFDGRVGTVVRSGDADSLASALELLIIDPRRRREMGAVAREMTLRHLAIGRVAERVLEAYGVARITGLK